MRIPLLARVLKPLIRSGIRGSTRIPTMLAESFSSLQRCPVVLADGETIVIDLRDRASRSLFAGAPYERSPWECEQQALMNRLVAPGDLVVDVGANVGIHTVHLSRLVGPRGCVLAFEPNPQLHATLLHTAKLHTNVRAQDVALFAGSGIAELRLHENHEMSALAISSSDSVVGSVTCRTRALDEALADVEWPTAPAFIKIDAEGAEKGILSGARQALSLTNPPVLMLEANRGGARAFGYDADDLPALVTQANSRYRVFIEVTPESWELYNAKVHDDLNQYLLAIPPWAEERWPGITSATRISTRRGSEAVIAA